MIAGPCSAESEEQVITTARQLKELGCHNFRAGVWKPRTKPGGFEGNGEKALPWMQRVKEETGMLVATEVATPRHVELALKYGIDIFWVGARTSANPFAVQALADALRGVDVPVFVKNPEYVAEGREDVYDYYFCDCLNFCVRYITPDGLVRTYAGRAPSTNGNIWGTEDGDLRQTARFRDVTGLAYDENKQMFYVLDHNNRSVRTIGKETDDTQTVATTSETTDGENKTTEGNE